MTPSDSMVLRALGRLLTYPDAELRAHLEDLRDVLRGGHTLAAGRLAELDALLDALAAHDPIETEAEYVQLFDRGRSTSLHLFEHVHGDSRDRGPAMIDLNRTYEQAGLFLAPGELPDYLPVVLEFVSTQPARQARDFLAEMSHILQKVFTALQQRGSAYASVLGAVLELAGEKAEAVKIAPEEALDDAWEEPAAFGGCSTAGQSKPGQPQPIRIVRNAAQPAAGAQGV